MFSKSKLLSVLLALTMLVTLAFLTGCEINGADDVTTIPGDVTSSSLSDPAAEGQVYDLIKNGVSSVILIRPDEAAPTSSVVKTTLDIRDNLQKYATLNDIEITTDWSRDGSHKEREGQVEILVGVTNYPETQQIMSELPYGDYTVRAVGNKIVIFGYTDETLSYASTQFIRAFKACVVEDPDSSPKTWTLSMNVGDFELNGTRDAAVSAIPAYENGVFSACYDPGDSCREIIIGKTSMEAYKAYLGKLEAAGYKYYTGREVTGNAFATYYNDKYTLNVGYYDYEKGVRIISEHYSDTTLIGLKEDNKFTPVTASQITMLGLEYIKDDSYVNNGLSVLIRLSDGRFVIIDGGHNRAIDANMLVAQMKAQALDPQNLTVAAWIITHPHSDHSDTIGKHYSVFLSNNIKVERFLVNFMSDAERNRAFYSSSVGKNWSSTEGSTWTQVYGAAAALGAEVVVTHVGQIYYLADLEVEVLYTIESYGPDVTNALNTTSQVMKMTFTDPKTQQKTVYMSTGDATGPAFLICSQMFGSYLKSDIVQVAHHGAQTYGTEHGTTSAYIAMAPATLLWPVGTQAYPSRINKSYNSVLWNTSTNPNYQETYVAGLEGTITVLPLPYTVGSAVVTAAH